MDVLTKSCVSARIWALYGSEPEAFKSEVVLYFGRVMPGYKVVKANPTERLIYLKREESLV